MILKKKNIVLDW